MVGGPNLSVWSLPAGVLNSSFHPKTKDNLVFEITAQKMDKWKEYTE